MEGTASFCDMAGRGPYHILCQGHQDKSPSGSAFITAISQALRRVILHQVVTSVSLRRPHSGSAPSARVIASSVAALAKTLASTLRPGNQRGENAQILEVSMKATQLLKKDHAAVKKLFAEFGRTTPRAPRRRQELMDRIAKELEIHSTIEEETFYPAVKTVPGGQSLVSEAESEHKEVDALVAEAQGMSMETDEVAQKVRELRDAVLHHATEEEAEMFPVAERGLGAELAGLGEQMASRKRELATSRIQKAKRAVKKAVRKTA
jgi:hemerythrin superfamily protein